MLDKFFNLFALSRFNFFKIFDLDFIFRENCFQNFIRKRSIADIQLGLKLYLVFVVRDDVLGFDLEVAEVISRLYTFKLCTALCVSFCFLELLLTLFEIDAQIFLDVTLHLDFC